jgi:hypothetical protein
VPARITAEDMQAARILTGATMAAWLVCGVIPGVRPYATKIRAALLIAYLASGAAFIAYLLLR